MTLDSDTDMSAEDLQEILLEILRVGLISIRNISEQPRRNELEDAKLQHWANLLHSLPAILLGGCKAAPAGYFINGDLKLFCSSYPAPRDADFRQILMLRAQLDRRGAK